MERTKIGGSKLNRFVMWVLLHFDKSYIFTPIATSNVQREYELVCGYEVVQTIKIGWTNVFVFGVRIASFQRTTPW